MDKSTNDYKFQEFCRVAGATAAQYDKEGLLNGKWILNFILSQLPLVKGFISDDFHTLIQEEITKSEGKSNVREHVKKILTYPLQGYLPWVEYNKYTPETIDSTFHFTLKNGKVYAFSPDKIAASIFSKLQDLEEFTGVELNMETADDTHITLVNSNIVYDIGIEKVQEFLLKYNEEFCVKFTNIKSTESYDWPVFSKCYVVGIESDTINSFIHDFNLEFGKSLKPSTHITVATRPRTLF